MTRRAQLPTVARRARRARRCTGYHDLGGRMYRKAIAACGCAVVLVLVLAAPAGAARAGSLRDDRRISISGGIIVPEGDGVKGPGVSLDGPVTVAGTVRDDVYVGNGRLSVGGHVTGDMFVVHGNVVVTGRVGGNVIALDGRITVRDGARVGGDVVSREQPVVASGASVGGDVK